ncbi:MAG TPA: malto-oligosyltrehalose synthase [Gemmatimonadales bacterium]|nr:malto-oligosyltrehalose synthase [Gemmatimonadales bacterium]
MPRRATYRVQLTADFGFDRVAEVADYLAALGVSHLYTSPYLQAAPDSTHGYDVVDHSRLSRELGGPEGHARMIAALQSAGLGHLIDTVPNHMSIATRDNRWWWDVLQNGLASPYARFFDVEWEPPEVRLRNTLLLPVLADQYGRALERGEIVLRREGSTFTVHYKEHQFPVEPRSLALLLQTAATFHKSDRLTFIADTFELLPSPTDTDPRSVTRRQRDQRTAEELLEQLIATEPAAVAALDRAVDRFNHDPNALDSLLDQQNYRLAWWQAAERDLGYRRFFDVNTLVGLRAEVPEVFAETHRLVMELVRSGAADGLRIDHVDGMQDPEAYLERLHQTCPCYVVVEKILAVDEKLPKTWSPPVEGTTGYDFLNLAGGLFIDPAAEAPLTQFYATFTGITDSYADVAHDKRLLVLREGLGSDVNRLAELLLRICERHRRHRDYTRHLLTEGLRELLASFPVYRTYVRPPPGPGEVREADQRTIDAATADAKRRRPDIDTELFDFLRAILTLGVRGDLESTFVRRFQQLSTAVMAKGVEDTAFYCYNRYVVLNEVGGDPSRFGVSPREFHASMADMQAHHPRTMLATSTHDTKRGEDVRARLAVLSECPGDWVQAVQRWAGHNERYRTGDMPDRNTEYLYYQILVGAWPLTAERALAYMQKATREAKTHTSWTSPSEKFEIALRRFIERTLDDPEFTGSVKQLVDEIVAPGRVVSLAQTLLKLTAPGIPDIYQGTELWSLTLVDPDNRRPVDYGLRRRLLEEIRAATPEQVLTRADEGVPKLWLIQRALAAMPRPEGCYQPLQAEGVHAEHVVAFARGGSVVTVVPRLAQSLRAGWGDTALPLPGGEARWRNVFTDEMHAGRERVANLFARFPVALLVRA